MLFERSAFSKQHLEFCFESQLLTQVRAVSNLVERGLTDDAAVSLKFMHSLQAAEDLH